jgi:hypothetical protein
MNEFVYLYRGGESGRSPEQAQKVMQKWMAWFKELAEKGHIKDRGQPLERTGKLVKGKQKPRTSWAVTPSSKPATWTRPWSYRKAAQSSSSKAGLKYDR